MKTVSICQPHFIPWIGYFVMIKRSNKFIFLDDVQYNRRSWQNRVHIRTSQNADQKKYLSLSVKDNTRSKKINEIYIYRENVQLLKNQLKNSYSRSKYFESNYEFFINLIEQNCKKDLSTLNIVLIVEICKKLKIKINYDLSSKFNLINFKKENLILEILKRENAEIYLSNEGSKNYVSKSFFEDKRIKVLYNEFNHPIYQQNFNKNLNFIPNLSILDLLFNEESPHKVFNNF